MSASARKGSGGVTGKKKKLEVVRAPVDELDALDTDALAEEVKKQQARLLEIRRHRNYYQLEKDQVQQYYDIVQDEVSKTESHLRNIEAQMERMQDTHRNDIRIYLQKVIHLEYEHENNIHSVHAQADADKEHEQKQHEQNKTDLKELKLSLKHNLAKTDIQHEEEIKRAKEVERKEMQKLREQFERNYQDLLSNYEQRLSNLKDDLELRKKMEIHEIEERKNRHINDLMIHHAKNFEEMRNYYNSITQDNLDLIKELNNEIEDLKIAHLQNEKAMEQIEKKNASLAEPLAQAENRVKALRHKLANYAKDKISLKHAKARLVVLEETYKTLQENHSKLKSEYDQVDRDRASLYDHFESTVASVQRKAAAKNDSLESMLEDYSELFDIKKAQFTSVLRASNLDPLVLSNVTRKLDDVLSSKNEQMEELKYEKAKVIKAHNDLVRVYEAKLRKMGVPEDQLHLEPLITQTAFHHAGTGTAPADLIVQ
jgi:hypothetical protein